MRKIPVRTPPLKKNPVQPFSDVTSTTPIGFSDDPQSFNPTTSSTHQTTFRFVRISSSFNHMQNEIGSRREHVLPSSSSYPLPLDSAEILSYNSCSNSNSCSSFSSAGSLKRPESSDPIFPSSKLRQLPAKPTPPLTFLSFDQYAATLNARRSSSPGVGERSSPDENSLKVRLKTVRTRANAGTNTSSLLEERGEHTTTRFSSAIKEKGHTTTIRIPNPAFSSYMSGCTSCNCRRSRCLKLYCECFKNRGYCSADCNCDNCHNTPRHEKEREDTIQLMLQRDPHCFDNHIDKKVRRERGV